MALDTKLLFYPLTFVPDAPDVIIGRKDIDSYAAFPEDGAELLKQLQAGNTVEAAITWYQERYGETLDIADFLETLRDLQFLRENGEAEQGAPVKQASPFWFWLGRAAFSPVAWLIYAALFLYSLWQMIRLPYLLPSYHNVFFSPYLVVLELGLFFGQFPGLLFHECYHILAGKRLGVSSRLGVGRRLYFLVFETHLDGLWSVPRKARYLPFLAGMVGDVLWFSMLVIIASFAYTPGNPYTFPGAFCLALALSTVLRFVWQFYFYLQTDIYYVFCNAFRCVDLQQTTWQYIWNRIYRLFRWKDKLQDEEEWHPRDKQVARWYSLFFGAGYLFSIGTLLLIGIPTAIQIFTRILHLILLHTFNTDFWDACVFISLNAIQVIVLALVFLREYRARNRERRLRDAA